MELNEAKQKYGKIADFISDLDKDDKLVLLPYSEFLKKYNSLEELEKYGFLKELNDCIMFGEISKKYITDEWTRINFERFVLQGIETIEDIVMLEDKLKFKVRINNEIQKTINSNLSVCEKIVSLAKIKMYYLDCVGRVKIEDDDILFDLENKLAFLKISEIREGTNQGNLKIPKKYTDFWMQFTKENLKTNKPYLAIEDVNIFLNQAFGNIPIEKTFNPEIDKKELYHAAWLFYRANRKDYKKPNITKIMKNNFPEHFPDELNKETKNIRDGLDHNKRLFHNI